MDLLNILTIPDSRLRVQALPVEKVDEEILRLLDNMLATLYANDGVGLAATQVGENKRVIVVDLDDHAPELGILKLVNPEIIWRSPETKKNWEACLSVPGQSAMVERSIAIRLRYLDEHNVMQEKDLDDLPAICLQHEIDHLDGVLYIDHLSALKRQLIVEKVQKYKKTK